MEFRGADRLLAQMGRLSKILAELDQLSRRVATRVVEPLSTEITREFRTGTDPYGRKWARLANGEPSYLTDTWKLRDGTRAALMPGGRKGVRIVIGASYGKFHQLGTNRMPARKILPERGMPERWRQIIKRAIAEEIESVNKKIRGI